MKTTRVRFAPSPTGYLHVGNARTALFNWLFARQQKGVFILRVEDTDVERSTAEYDRKLMEDLRWLGLDWDEGPDVRGEYGPYRQSQRLDFYKAHAEKLLEEDKAYPCFCSHDELEEERKKALDRGLTPVYSGKCCRIPKEKSSERIALGEEAAIRLRTPDEGNIGFHDLVRGPLEFDLSLIGDPILLRSNGLPAYNYAVVVDDFLMAITHVIRGEDHIQNTPRQILTCRALGFDSPVFAHLSMVMGKDNTRLSKRHGATAVDQFDREGILPSSLFNYLALLGWAPPDGREVLTQEELIQLFNLEKVSRSSSIFDYDKLAWINRHHIKILPPSKKAEYAFPHLKAAGLLPEEMSPGHWVWLEQAVEAFAEKIDRFSQLSSFFSGVFEFSLATIDDDAKEILKERCSLAVIKSFADKIARVKNFNYGAFGQMAKEIKEDTGCKGKELYHPLRVALTAKTSGLELDKFIPIVEEGAKLTFPTPIKSCAQRVSEILAYIGSQTEEKMDFFEFALDMEKKTIESYRTLAEKCQSNEGVKNILLMLADDHEKHIKTLKEMPNKTAVEMDETEAFREARQVFSRMQEDKTPFSCDIDQVKLYEDARDLVLKKRQFYLETVEKVEPEDNKTLIKRMAEEEKKQAVVLGNIIEMVRRPETWLEDAEFHHLDEY